MRTLKKVAAMVLAMMAAMTQAVWDGAKWVVKSAFPNPSAPTTGGDVEQALDRVAATPPADVGAPLPLVSVDAGQVVFDYALSKLSDGRHPRPAMSDVPEDIVRWASRLSADELRRLAQHGPRRVGEHVLGVKAIADLPLCREARVEPGFAKIGNVIQYVGKVHKADVGPAPVRELTPHEHALAILADLIDDQPEPAGLKAA